MPLDVDRKAHREYIFNVQEFNRILERFPADGNFYLSFVVPYNIGTRISETFAIDLIEDIDLENHELHIKRQMIKIQKTWYFKAPKYDSYRTIKIGITLEQALKHAIHQRKLNRLTYGKNYINTYVLSDHSLIQFRANIEVPYKEITPLCVKDNGELLTPESFKYCARVIHKHSTQK